MPDGEDTESSYGEHTDGENVDEEEADDPELMADEDEDLDPGYIRVEEADGTYTITKKAVSEEELEDETAKIRGDVRVERNADRFRGRLAAVMARAVGTLKMAPPI